MKWTHLNLFASCALALFALFGCVEETSDGGGATGFCAGSEANACQSDADCAGDLRCAAIGGAQVCVQPCGSDSECGGAACSDFGSAAANNDPNNTSNNTPNNTGNNTPNNTGNNTPNNTPNNTGNNTDDLCVQACNRLTECLDQVCTQPLVDPAACTSQCDQDPVGFGADQIVALDCGTLNESLLGQICQDPQAAQVCECPSIEPQETSTGEPCAGDGDCEAGVLTPFCITETDAMTGEDTGFPGGYCTAIGCQADEQCGTDNLCVQIDQQGTTACFAGCDPATNGAGECRDGYACLDVSMGQGVGLCFAACTADEDCGPEGTCNVETGQCQ